MTTAKRNKGNKLNFRNLVQMVLWNTELSGQISDGQWENASPHNHWLPWCDTQTAVDPENVGRNFYAQKANYNLNARDLLDCVGDRMLFKAKFALLYPKVAVNILELHHSNYPENVDELRNARIYAERFGHYHAATLEQWEAAGLTQEMLDATEAFDGFTMKELNAALRDMKAIIRTRI